MQRFVEHARHAAPRTTSRDGTPQEPGRVEFEGLPPLNLAVYLQYLTGTAGHPADLDVALFVVATAG